MIDTHCHLDLPIFDDDRAAVLARARAAGVIGVLVPAIRPRTWEALRALAASDPLLRHAIGIHPQVVPALGSDELDGDLVERLVGAAQHAVAIGECGLDGGTGAQALQEHIFRAHIRAARQLRRPLVIHVLRAHDVALRLMREERVHEVGGVMHSYSGGAVLVPVYAELGLRFSFAGPVTYANARRPVEAARAVPAELLLAETDAPDQSPAIHRGRRSEPAYVVEVIAGLSTATGQSHDDVVAMTTANARRLFATW